MSRTLKTAGIISATLAFAMLQSANVALAGQAQDRGVRKAIAKYSRIYGTPISISRSNVSSSVAITFSIDRCQQLIVFVAANGRISTMKSQSCTFEGTVPPATQPPPDDGGGGEGGGDGGGIVRV